MEQLPLDLGFPNPVAAAQKNAFFPPLLRIVVLGHWMGLQVEPLDGTSFPDFSAYLGLDPVLQIKVSSRHVYEINSVALYL